MEEKDMVLKVSMPNYFQFKTMRRFQSLIMDKSGDIHYIGGTEVLPPPLEPAIESEMIEALATKDAGAKSALIEHNLRLVVYIAKRFDNTGVGVEDLISIGTIGLIKAVDTFNPDKNIKLATETAKRVWKCPLMNH